MTIGLEERVDLEGMLSNDESLVCTSEAWHHCSRKARWITYGRPQCTESGTSNVLWCDTRYADWKRDCDSDWNCLCGLPQKHWKVLPL